MSRDATSLLPPRGLASVRRLPRPAWNLLLVAVLIWPAWAWLMSSGDRWSLFAEKWFMSVTMLFGSLIAGASAEGGGAVAFPAMTLLFGIPPAVARDFSLIIQAVGMSAAAFMIFASGTRIEWRALLFAGSGGAAGVALGASVLSGVLAPPMVKMFFVSFWLGFGVALFWIHHRRRMFIHEQIPDFGPRHALLLIVLGCLGGTVSGMTGSGLDIVTFSLLTLCFRVCPTVATPTSVVLMATNALVGSIWIGGPGGGIAAEAWAFWYVCVPVCVVGAPLGAWAIRSRSAGFIVKLLLTIIVTQYAGALLILDQTLGLLTLSAVTFVASVGLYWMLARRSIARSRDGDMSVPTAMRERAGESSRAGQLPNELVTSNR